MARDTSKFFVSVVVRQKDTQLSDEYMEVPFDISKPPGPLPQNKASGAVMGVSVAAAVVGAAAVAFLAVWLVRRQRAKQVYNDRAE